MMCRSSLTEVDRASSVDHGSPLQVSHIRLQRSRQLLAEKASTADIDVAWCKRTTPANPPTKNTRTHHPEYRSNPQLILLQVS